MSVVKHRKTISFIMIITMLLFGMCFNSNVESYSFLECEKMTAPRLLATTGEFYDNTAITSDICASSIRENYTYEMSNEQILVSGHSRRFARSNVRILKNEEQAMGFVSTCLLLFLYFMLWELCLNLHKIYSNLVVAGYIHQQDGQKVYSF